MSIKYFTGSNAASNTFGVKNSRHTVMTSYWYPETAPANGADGTDAKGQGIGSKWDRVKAKYHSTSALGMKGGKSRGTACIGKYELGKMWKMRKTAKRLMSAAGHTATATAVGERSLYNNKGNGNTGDTAQTKNIQSLPLADGYELWPFDAGK